MFSDLYRIHPVDCFQTSWSSTGTVGVWRSEIWSWNDATSSQGLPAVIRHCQWRCLCHETAAWTPNYQACVNAGDHGSDASRLIGNLEEARGHLEDALQRLRQSFLPQNLLEAKTLCTLGTVFHKLATQTTTEHNPFVARLSPWYYKYKGHKLLNTALDMARKVCDSHPNIATVLAAIGRLDLDSGDLHSAKLHLEEALDIQTKCCGSIHPNIALYHQLLAKVASQTGEKLSAKSHSQKADKIYRELITKILDCCFTWKS